MEHGVSFLRNDMFLSSDKDWGSGVKQRLMKDEFGLLFRVSGATRNLYNKFDNY